MQTSFDRETVVKFNAQDLLRVLLDAQTSGVQTEIIITKNGIVSIPTSDLVTCPHSYHIKNKSAGCAYCRMTVEQIEEKNKSNE